MDFRTKIVTGDDPRPATLATERNHSASPLGLYVAVDSHCAQSMDVNSVTTINPFVVAPRFKTGV